MSRYIAVCMSNFFSDQTPYAGQPLMEVRELTGNTILL